MYSQEGLIGEYDATGNQLKGYGYKPNSIRTTDPVFLRQGGQYYFYQNDHLGTPKKLVDINGNIVWSTVYTAFGKALVDPQSTILSNFRFAGQYYDSETGLHYNYYRFYDPTTGRYLTPDPIGLNGGINLYTYVENNPVNFFDPLGLRPLTDSEKGYLAPYIPQRDLDNADVIVGKMPWYAPQWADGITRGNKIYFKDPNQTFNTPADLGLLGHELVHVGQYAEGMTWLSYLWVSRKGYDNNPYEIPAYEMQRRITRELTQQYGTSCP